MMGWPTGLRRRKAKAPDEGWNAMEESTREVSSLICGIGVAIRASARRMAFPDGVPLRWKEVSMPRKVTLIISWAHGSAGRCGLRKKDGTIFGVRRM